MLYHSNADGQYSPNLTGLAEEVTTAVTILAKHKHKFDGIVVTGMSGVVPGVPVSLALNKPLVILRKEGDDSHAGEKWINKQHITPDSLWLFFDDFVAGGETRSRVLEQIHRAGGHVVGQYLTHPNEFALYDSTLPAGDFSNEEPYPFF